MTAQPFAHLDLLSGTRLMGWCKTKGFDPAGLRLQVHLDGNLLISAAPHINRADVFDIHGGHIKCGFDCKLPNVARDDCTRLAVTICDLASGAVAAVDILQALKKQASSPSSYQSFNPGAGSSPSERKLAAIALPDLTGKRFLDIGCNAGFFCKYALDQGASRVVGIEAQKKFADEARENAPGAVILNQPWSRLPDEQFDVIIMLSALHYEKNPKEFLSRIRRMLAPNGVFVFEGGVVQSEFTLWKTVHRGVGAVKYPSTSLLQNHLLADFAYRYIGPSVSQPGDPLPRHVYHCNHKRPVWTVLRGKGREGKTSLARSFAQSNMPTMRIDRLMTDHWLAKIPTGDPLFDAYIKDYQPRNIAHWVDGVTDPALAKSIAHYLAETFPTECDCLAEGYVLSNDLIFDAFISLAKTKGVRVWVGDRVI
jgi:SAM-dependent methyltransferase